MQVYDIIQGYQPYFPNVIEPEWVGKNLNEIFLPTSKAMSHGIVKRSVGIKGWTLDNWNKTHKLENKSFIKNLKLACKNKYIDIGFSAYSHAILPILSTEVIKAMIALDYNVVSKYIGKPTWFWPPEGAVSKELLKIIYELYPDIVVVIPDLSLKKFNYSGITRVKHSEDKFQKVIIINTLLTDVFMNIHVYDKTPEYIHIHQKSTIKEEIKMISKNPQILYKFLDLLNPNLNVLARDWENAGSVTGLQLVKDDALESAALMGINAEFKLPSNTDFSNAEIVDIEQINDACWGLESGLDNPLFYWVPQLNQLKFGNLTEVQKTVASEWYSYISDMNEQLTKWLTINKGHQNVINSPKLCKILKSILPSFLSCVPWHFLANPAYGRDQSFSTEIWDKILIPNQAKLRKLLERN